MTTSCSVIPTPKYKGLSGILESLCETIDRLFQTQGILYDAHNQRESFTSDDLARHNTNLTIERVGEIHQKLARLASMVPTQDEPMPGYQAPELPEIEHGMPLDQLMTGFRKMVQFAKQWPSPNASHLRPAKLTMTTYNRLVKLTRAAEKDLLGEEGPYPFQSVHPAKTYETTLFYDDMKALFLLLDEASTTLHAANSLQQETNPCAEPVTDEDMHVLAEYTGHLQGQWFELMSELEPLASSSTGEIATATQG